MAIEGGAAARNAGGRSGGGVLKKGPWTTAEDAVLTKYVEKHGEGNWNAVQRNSGLMRCGKSCRLRWANHLRPDLKKGAFTPEEERKIIELHAKLGNKWARMALHLNGRTDNEIKNYWNTRLKKRQRAGLPIYPLNIQRNQNPNSLSSLHQNPNFYRSHPSVFNSFTFTSPNAPFPYDNSHFKLMRDTNGSVALSLSSSSNKPFSIASSTSPVPPHYNQVLPQTNFSMNAFPTTMGASFNGFTCSQTEPPSIQSSPFEAITQSSSTNTNQSEYVFPTSSEADNYEVAPNITNQSEYVFPTSSEADNYEVAPKLYSRENSGLLGDMLGDSQDLSSFEKGKGKGIQEWEQMKDFIDVDVDVESIFKVADSNTTSENNLEDSSTGHSSFEIGMNSDPIDNVFEEMNFLTEYDLSSLLDDFLPISEPITDCYAENDDASTERSPDNVTSGNVGGTMVNKPELSCSPVMAAPVLAPPNQKLIQETCWWNNVPGFS